MVEKQKFMKTNKLKTKIISTKLNKKNSPKNYSKTRKKTKQIGDWKFWVCKYQKPPKNN